MNKFNDYEGVICKDRAELLLLAKMAKEKGYKVNPKIINRPRYSHIIFFEGYFCDAADWAIKDKISKEEFIKRLNH